MTEHPRLPIRPVSLTSGPAPTIAQWDKLCSLAQSNQWRDYRSEASAFGCLCPYRPEPANIVEPSPLTFNHFLDLAESANNPILLAFRQTQAPEHMLDSMKAELGSEYFALIAQELIDSTSESMFQDGLPPSHAHALARAGCDTRAAATAAAHCGSLATLRAYLDAGLDPNFGCDGSMPPLFMALTKERAFGMSDKMACAKELYARGASLRDYFSSHAIKPGFPRSLLELGLANDFPETSSNRHIPPPASDFAFPWNYFSEADIPIEEILPDASDVQGALRIAAIITRPAANLFDERQEPLSFAEGARQRGAHGHPWLAAAFDAIALRLEVPLGRAPTKRPPL